MTERLRKKEISVEYTTDQHITHILRQGDDSRPRSPGEMRSLLGGSSETVAVKVVPELQLVSHIIGR
jgi:hypothetical protein